ncbi:MAG TPA: SCO family protein [Solirubrobacteraceae bacterium]|nr:SCO family protein [Solirubrobacteraceae bacterium]
MHRAGSNPRLLLSLLAFVVFAGGALLGSGCGSSGSSKQQTTASTTSAAKVAYKAEAVLTPATAEPPLKLRNYLGQPVNIDQYRGKPVLITFVYTHCPDVCPLMISNLRVAQNLMGATGPQKTQVIAVSVDSKGDTRKSVTAFLKQHEMTGRMQYLIGSRQELARVWKAWGVGSERDAKNPDFVEHSGLVYGITASGKRAVLYSASFKPAAIVHDVPLLASN